MSNYWYERQEAINKQIENKTIKQTNRQLKKYYKKAMERVIEDFEATYDKLMATIAQGRDATPADLYKLDKYWKSQAELKKILQELGDKKVALLSKEFEDEWMTVYNAIANPSDSAFSTVSTYNAKEMVNQMWLTKEVNKAWLPDGKTLYSRVWGNLNKLTDTLNDELLDCVITGKSTRQLKKNLMTRFNVSYHQANTLVKTEAAHIKTQAAAQRYQDYGLTQYKYMADTDDKTCKHKAGNCEDLDGKIFKYSEMQAGKNAPPMHPNCRCYIVPVINEFKG